MKRGPHDWIVDADVPYAVEDALREARERLTLLRAGLGLPPRVPPDEEGSSRAARLAGRLSRALGALAPWSRPAFDREVVEALDRTLAALAGSLDWQRARIDYLGGIVAGLARAPVPRPWAGADERPAILLGTGGGGTRVLAEAAARLGVFLGATVNESFDSVEWAPLVYALVAEAGGAAELPRGGFARERILEAARAIYAPWVRDGVRVGLKIPEVMLVLPLFLEAFSEAQVVLLVRHPVAASLRRPHLTTLPEHPIGRLVLDAAYRAAGRDPARIAADPQHLRNALAWRHQVGRVHRHLAAEVPPGRVLRVRLEDFHLSPERTGAALADLLGVARPRLRELVRIEERRLPGRDDAGRAAEVMALCGDVAADVGYPAGWLDADCEEPGRRATFAGCA